MENNNKHINHIENNNENRINDINKVEYKDEKNDVYILGIETSCDETAASIVKNGREVLSCIISSQIPEHRKFGGVVPEVASRKHIENIDGVIDLCLEEAKMELKDIDAVAVTGGPGLVGALLVGLQYAKGLAFALNKKLIYVNHIEGHISANYIDNKELEPPFLSLVVSGGHTFIVKVKDYDTYEVMARTRDDAVGEAYDKVARALGLSYPGGPEIDKLAKEGNELAIKFPRPDFHEETYDFSFSGIKSAVLNYLNSAEQKGIEVNKKDVAASFQKSVIDNLLDNVLKILKRDKIDKLAVAGGVASNSYLRKRLKSLGEEENIQIIIPSPLYCTDNAVMIAARGYHKFIAGDFSKLSANAEPNLTLE